MGAENCADSCGRRGCKEVAGNGWGEEAAGDHELGCGRLQTGNGLLEMGGEEAAGGERACLRGRLRTARVQGSGWKWVGIALVMSELGCADGCGRQMGAEKHADGCGRLRTARVQARSGWKWVGMAHW